MKYVVLFFIFSYHFIEFVFRVKRSRGFLRSSKQVDRAYSEKRSERGWGKPPSGIPAEFVRVLAGTRTCIVLSCVEALYWFLTFSRARYVANGAFEPVVGKEQIEDVGL